MTTAHAHQKTPSNHVAPRRAAVSISVRDDRGFVSQYEDFEVDIDTAREVLALLSREATSLGGRPR